MCYLLHTRRDSDTYSPSSPSSAPVGSEETEHGVQNMTRIKSLGSFKREFKLDDVCDYVQTGVQVRNSLGLLPSPPKGGGDTEGEYLCMHVVYDDASSAPLVHGR